MVVNRNSGEGEAAAQRVGFGLVSSVPTESLSISRTDTVVARCKYRKSPIYREPPFYSKFCL